MKTTIFFALLLLCFSPLSSQSTNLPTDVQWEDITFTTVDGREVAAQRGSFSVPLDYTAPEDKKLTLRFVRFPSTNPKPGSPIVYLAGGPGGSGVQAAMRSRFDLFQSFRTVADVIAFDQRGTGASDGPPQYPELWTADLDEVLDRDKYRDSMQVVGQKAADFYAAVGHPLSAYNTNASADDLNGLRVALGAEKISLWGISYGTHLALTTLKRHEKHLDKIIIAGVEGYDQTVKMPADQQMLLEQIDDLLKADTRTADVYPDFLGDLARLLQQVEREPVTLTSQHPFTRDSVEVVLGKFDLQQLLAMSLRGPNSFRDLPHRVKLMLAGDFSSLAPYAIYPKMLYFRAMPLGMDLASGISQERMKELVAQRDNCLLSDAINFPYLELREALPTLDAGPAFRKPYASDLPILAISGTLDGRTPPGNATETLRHFPNGVHLIIDGAGHSDPLFLSSPRIEEVMLDYLMGKTVRDETITLPPVDFTLPEAPAASEGNK